MNATNSDVGYYIGLPQCVHVCVCVCVPGSKPHVVVLVMMAAAL